MSEICIRCWGNRPLADMKPSPLADEMMECADRALCDAWAAAEAQTHYCANMSWKPEVQAVLDGCKTIEDLAKAWIAFAAEGRTDGIGGGEWRHALDHMRWLSEHDWTPPANPRSLLDDFQGKAG